jgi:hypothetical protein
MNESRDAGEVDVSLIYADYYFIEALLRYKKVIKSTVAVNRSPGIVLSTIDLFQNYPNPFNGKTILSYELAMDGEADLSIYSVLGEKVRTLKNGLHVKGRHTLTWDGNDESGNPVSSGVYYYQLNASKSAITKRMLLVK